MTSSFAGHDIDAPVTAKGHEQGDQLTGPSDQTTRRELLRSLGFGAGALAMGGPGLLTACSSNSDTSGGSATTSTSATGAGGSTTTAPQGDVAPFDPSRPYWVQGNFRPVTTEETITDLEVVGSLPPELSGLFVRNGSNPPSGESLHWFLGDGMLHGVRIEAGKASWYRNRYVTTPLATAGKDVLNFGGVPGKENNQSNVAVVHHAGKLLSTGEVGWPFHIDTSDLSTVGAWDFGGRLGATMTAHPKVDPITGKMHFFGYEFIEPRLSIYTVAADGTMESSTIHTPERATMVHDFAITDRDAVFWDGPVVFGSDPGNLYPDVPFTWEPEGRASIGVMPLGGRAEDLRWIEIPLCYVFHGLNAHRDGDDIVAYVHPLEEAFGPRGDLVDSFLTEWRIGTAGPDLTFSERRLFERPMDLPTHDRRLTGRRSRHGWCATTFPPDSEFGFEFGGVCHVDLQTETEDNWDPGPNLRAGEAFFVPADPAADGSAHEGEGWLLTYVWDRTTDRSSLAVFDALDVAKGPIAEVELPVRVPFGFHGYWLDESLL